MNLDTFIEQYGSHIQSYKQYDNGVIRIKFAKGSNIMWLKGLVCDLLDMEVKTSSVATQTYWFQPH